MMLRIDLHLHTTESDGMLDPAALMRSVAAAGLDLFAVTDHDTMAAYVRSAPVFSEHASRLVAGVELSTVAAGREVHILGYNISPGCDGLQRLLEERVMSRITRAERIVAALNAAGVAVSMDEVRRQATGTSIGRPHVARALVDRGHARDIGDAFARYIGSEGIAYEPLSGIASERAIATVRECGGVAVLAHPALNGAGQRIAELQRAGLQGVEVYSPSHTPHEVAYYRALARDSGLVVTGGTDFHAPSELYPRPGVEIEASELAPFLELIHR